MAGVSEEFSVFDEFAETLDRFNSAYEMATSSFEQSERAAAGVARSDEDMASASTKAAESVGSGGLGGAFLMLNQAMQFFERIAGKVMESLDDIGDKQRSFILLGKEAGAELNNFAKQAASSMGRAEGEIRKAGQAWSRLGVGGNNIKELTTLADRFANLNPDKEYKDVVDSFTDAIKSRSSSGLADLLGGGDVMEQKLERTHIDKYLKQGDISTALDKFKELADEVGYTQEKADELGNTFDKKVMKIINRVKNYFTDLVSDIVSTFEPLVDKVMDWLDSEDVQSFFSDLKDEIVMATSAAAALIDALATGLGKVKDAVAPVVEKFKDIATEAFPFLKEESLGVVDTLIGIFVGGVGQLVYGVIELAQHMWNGLVTMAEKGINGLITMVEGLANGVVWIGNKLKSAIIGLASSIIGWLAELLSDIGGTKLGKMLGIDEAAESIEAVNRALERAKQNKIADVTIKRVDLSEYKADPIDSVGKTAALIDKAISKTHSYFNRSIDEQNKANDKANDALGDIVDNTGKLVSQGQREEDLRWMKEMAEQHFINEINLRQLTPTIQLRVDGANNKTPNQYAKALAAELQKMADAGTFNVYGNVG